MAALPQIPHQGPVIEPCLSWLHQCPAPAEPLLAGGIAEELPCIGAIAEPLLAGACVEAPVAGGIAGEGAAAVAEGGGVAGTWDADSLFFPHALKANTAARETQYIRIGRVIFIEISCFRQTNACAFVAGAIDNQPRVNKPCA